VVLLRRAAFVFAACELGSEGTQVLRLRRLGDPELPLNRDDGAGGPLTVVTGASRRPQRGMITATSRRPVGRVPAVQQAGRNHQAVAVAAEGADSRLPVLEVLAGPVEIAELAVALAEVEVQRRLEPAHGARQPGPRRPLVRDEVGGGQRSQVPGKLLAEVVLHVGHRVGKPAAVQRVAALADVGPDLCDQVACGFAIASVTQLDRSI